MHGTVVGLQAKMAVILLPSESSDYRYLSGNAVSFVFYPSLCAVL
jgi:hypothetical protein